MTEADAGPVADEVRAQESVRVRWFHRRLPSWSLKAFAVGASTILVLTVFSQFVGTASSPGDGGADAFAEQARRLTIAPGASRDPRVAFSPSGALHLAWIDARDGADGVYAKASRDGGLTFGADAPLASGLRDARDLTLAASRQGTLVGAAWSARPNASAPAQVYVRASSDDGRSWGTPGIVGPGRAPSLAAASDTLFLAYAHGNAPSGQVRLVALDVSGGSIRGGRALLGFNASALDVALAVTGGRAHVVWAESLEGGSVIAHVSVTLATKQASSAHVVATVRGGFGGRLALVGRGDALALVWSDDSLGTFDVLAAHSGDAGETWTFGPAVDTGPSEARAPAIALGEHGVAVAWRDDRTGTPQVFGRLATLGGTFRTAARRISDSPSGVEAPAVAFGAGRDLALAWSDARDGNGEVYADVDVLLDRPRARTMRTYVRRLAPEDFAPPARQSRALLLGLIDNASERVERQEEENAVAFLEGSVMPRFDGYRGGDPRDDLVVNATAQADLMNLAERLVLFLRGSGGTRLGDGEPDPPPPGDPGDPGPQPLPDPDEDTGDTPTLTDVVIDDVTATSAAVAWNVTATPPVEYAWVDWGRDAPNEHRTWDNATPYEIALSPLVANASYKIRAGALRSSTTYWSDTYTFVAGVVMTNVSVTNATYDTATVEWTTNLPATSVVKYGYNASNLYATVTASNGTFHQVNLTGLGADPELGVTIAWYARARSVALSDPTLVKESRTLTADTGLHIDGLTRTAAQEAGYYNVTFAWKTSYEGLSEVRFGTNSTLSQRAYGASGTTHTVTLTNLSSASTYQWQVISKDTSNSRKYACVSSTGAGADAPGHTPCSADGEDTSPIATPAVGIQNVSFDRGETWIRASWETTYPANANLTHWQGGGTKTSIVVGEATTVHSVNVTNLGPGATYTILLKSQSASNPADVASSPERQVTTRRLVISAVSVFVQITNATINWTTSVNGTSVVDYGIHYAYENRVTGSGNGTSHSLLLTGLLAETTYYYSVRSASLANLNDTVADSFDPATQTARKFTTMAGPNDANSSMDAGNVFAAALPVEPGVWKGWVNLSAPYNDGTDFFQVYAYGGAQIHASLSVPPSPYNLDLYVYRATGGAPVCQSTNAPGVPEALTCSVGANEAGYWRLEVRRTTGSNRGAYTLSFTVVGGGPERFTLDVGASGDTSYATRTPGLSVGTAGWGSSQVSGSPSTAVDAYRTNPFPNYREVTANGTFYLNLYRTSAERYADYAFTVQSYGSQDSNVSVWNGAGWVTIASVPGVANWRAASFVLEHTLFYDAEPTWAGMNVKMRFEKPVQVDLIAAVPSKYTTYVGNGSDDDTDEYHMPGLRTFDGWVNQGMGYKNATASGATILVTPADLQAGYLVRMRFDGVSSGFTVQRCTGTCGPVAGWVFATSASNFTAGEALFTLDPAWYVDAFPEKPGVNVWLRLVPKDRLNETTMFVLEPTHWTTDVGVTGDNVIEGHLPGMSVYTNGEWSLPQNISGRSVRLGDAYADVYLNMPWPYGSMIAYVTYRAFGAGSVQVFDGMAWITVGAIEGGDVWTTSVLFVQGSCVGGPNCGGFGGPSLRTFHDEYGDAFVNVLLRFTVPVTLDAMWVDVDADGDNLTSYGEPNAYAYVDATTHHVYPGQPLNLDWFAPVEGRWQFDVTASLLGHREGGTTYYAALEASVDGSVGWSAEVGFRPQPLVVSGSFGRMLCTGERRLRLAATGSDEATVTMIAYRKVPTDPDRADTDGDGLRDGQEACAKRTDPTVADTDGDGLTDYEETYAFSYNNATSTAANVTVNVTVDAVGEYHWRIKTSGTPQNPHPVEVIVYLDGQLKWSKKSVCAQGQCTSWSNYEAAFDAILPKGLHSLQVQRASATGTVTLGLVNVSKTAFTNALYRDSDHDTLTDGDELLGKTGWMLSPTKADTDGDGAKDGDEVLVLHTDPLLTDTDHDGYNDKVDLDPLYDLVVQVRVAWFSVYDLIGGTIKACSRQPCSYWARPHVAGKWTNSSSVEDTDNDGNVEGYAANHLLSVNVPDDAPVTVAIQVFANDIEEPNLRPLDVAPGPSATYTTTMTLTEPDRYGNITQTDTYAIPHATVAFDIRVFRVGKANTLLVVPNDWSTLSNGTVDGAPTGLHRYVGEQRFVFVLLNVTDGAGDLASFDFETKDTDGEYADLSGNGLHAWHYGDLSVPGRFGAGAQLSGTSGSAIAVSDDDTLDSIDDAMTVAVWVRPGTDYLFGSGWHWSFGRAGLWRLGFQGDGVVFEVDDLSGVPHAAGGSIPLYAGRWYHLAGVLDGGQLSVYVNGELLGTNPNGPSLVRDGAASLYLGHDASAGTDFHGVVDEFRLYTRALTQDAIRGLMWFLQGANSVLLPRGVFFDSLLLKQMTNASAEDIMNGPLAGATIHGNDDNGSASLNSRVIQMVIAKNVTVAQAYGVLGLVLTNQTGHVTAFALSAADEFYTLGLAQEVDDLVANDVVENSGNFTAPPPSPTFWDQFWNAIAGLASAVWNAVVAVAMFFVNVVKWLVNVFVGVAIGLVTGDWTYFQENVIEPFVAAMEAFLQFIVDLAKSAISGLVSAIANGMRGLLNGIYGGLVAALSILAKPGSADTGGAAEMLQIVARIVIVTNVFAFLAVFIRAIELLVAVLTAGIGWLVMKVISRFSAEFVVRTISAIAFALASAAVFGEIAESMGWVTQTTVYALNAAGWPVAALAGALDLVVSIAGMVHARKRGEPPVVKLFSGFALALFGLVTVLVSPLVSSGFGLAMLDLLGLFLAVLGVMYYVPQGNRGEVRAINTLSSLGKTFEEIVVYGSVPLAGIAMIVHVPDCDQ